MLLRSIVVTPIEFSGATGLSPVRLDPGMAAATRRRQGGFQTCHWWLPWRIFAFSRDGPHPQYCWLPQGQIFNQ